MGFNDPYSFGFMDNNGVLQGALIFDNYNRETNSIYVSMVLIDRRCFTRAILRDAAQWVYIENKIKRMSATIISSNKESIHMCRRLGFVQEGCLRKASKNEEDVLVFGMLKEDCRWLDM